MTSNQQLALMGIIAIVLLFSGHWILGMLIGGFVVINVRH